MKVLKKVENSAGLNNLGGTETFMEEASTHFYGCEECNISLISLLHLFYRCGKFTFPEEK